jgi:hypothetical protein
MFFETNQINEALLCINCEGKLEEPKILPCGETICLFCVTSLKIVDKMFDCLVCKEKHEMPKDGLLNNKFVVKILSIKPTKVSRGKDYDTFQDLLKHIGININLIKIGVNNSDDFIKEHCIEMRNEVQLVTEVTIEHINDYNSEIIKEIDKYEKERLEINKSTKKIDLNSFDSSLKDLNEFLKEMQSFYDENVKCLKENQIRDSVIAKLNENAISMKKKSEDKLKCLQQINFSGRVLKFDAKFNEKISLGTLKMIDNRMSSNILSGRDQVNDLISLCGFPIDQKWNLIYRASQDGFEAAKFHAKCDNKPNTLIIIKTTNGNVFGGYTDQSWSGNDSWKADPNSFIFSLINLLNEPIIIKWSKNKGIFCSISYGPTFGGYDFKIVDSSNTNTNSFSNLGHSYTHPDYRFETNEAKSFLAGSCNFQVSEIEVYTKQ